MDESSAIALCLKHQDPVGFEFLFRKYRREALFHARALLGNEDDAADACQESFTRAFIALPRLTHLDCFYPWFYRILRNYCLNMINRKKTSDKYQTEKKNNPDLYTGTDSPCFLLEQSEEKIRIWEALQALPAEFREILTMKYIKELSYNEIVEILGIPRGTVMSRLFYARTAFKNHYELDECPRKEFLS